MSKYGRTNHVEKSSKPKKRVKALHRAEWCCPMCAEDDTQKVDTLRPGYGYCHSCGWEGLIEESRKDYDL